MANYAFMLGEERQTLATVDDEICRMVGKTPDKDHFSMEFNAVVEVGFSILMGRGGFEVTPEVFDEVTEALDKTEWREDDHQLFKLAKVFLCGTYTFRAWR